MIYEQMNNENKIIKLSETEAKEIFPTNKHANMNNLLITTEGQYSVSKKKAAKKLVNIIYKNMKTYNITITDATSNVGSDSLMLAKYFENVNSVEYDKINYEAFNNNVEVYKYNNINMIYGDSLIKIPTLKQDVIYADFPWGGPDYKKMRHMGLYMGKIELSEFFNRFRNNAKLHIYKVPFNYDINNFLIRTKVKNLKIYSYQANNRIKFLFMIIRNFV